jgi:hypothetical protein
MLIATRWLRQDNEEHTTVDIYTCIYNEEHTTVDIYTCIYNAISDFRHSPTQRMCDRVAIYVHSSLLEEAN